MSDQFESLPDSGKSEAEPPGDYQVGYKKAPKHARFQKGISGNPAGRHKSDGNLRRYLANFMDEAQATSSEVRMSRREALVRTLIESARRGKTRAFKIFLQHARKAKLFDPPADERPRSGVVTYKYGVAEVLAETEKVRAERKDVLARAARGELKEISND